MARVAVLSGAALVGFVPSGHTKAAESKFVFDLVRSPGLKAIPGCVPTPLALSPSNREVRCSLV